MGGIGSGRRWQFGVNTTDDYRSIDIRWLKREGLLVPGVSRRIVWSRDGAETGSVDIQSAPKRVILSYRQRGAGSDYWQAEKYPIFLDRTPCHLGGERHWFLCPARGCNRRVAILYGGAIFACRHCYQLAYPSQREKPWDRAARRADRIRDKLGWVPGFLNGSFVRDRGHQIHFEEQSRSARLVETERQRIAPNLSITKSLKPSPRLPDAAIAWRRSRPAPAIRRGCRVRRCGPPPAR